MLISILLQLVATIFSNRPPGIQPGQWSPHARDAVQLLESRHFRHAVPPAPVRRVPPAPVRRVPPRRTWIPAPRPFTAGDEGEWTCKP